MCVERQNRAGQGKAGQGRAGQGREGPGRARQTQSKARQGKARQGRAGQGRAGQGKARQGKVRQGKAKAKQGNPDMKPDKAQYSRSHVQYTTSGYRVAITIITKQGSGVVHKETSARPCQSGWCTNSTGQGRGMDAGSYSQQHWHSR